jgi:hypothetical protein
VRDPPRPRFQPDLVRGGDRDALNAEFALQTKQFELMFRCPECAYRTAKGQCTVGWPNDALMAEPLEAIGADLIPVFCKAFEPDAP